MPDASGPSTNFSSRDVYVSQDAEDADLVKRCIDGDTAAFAPLVERYQRPLFTVALRMLGDADDAKDAAQDTFIKAFRKLPTFDPTRRFFSWLYRILVNECLNARRSRRTREPIGNDVAAGATPEDLYDRQEQRQRLLRAIVMLPLEYRQVIVLRHFTELSYDDMADTLEISTSLVRSRLYSARRRLGELIAGKGPLK
jgi:RNA polymerase sigma-70 factor (ECF subfamily)